MPNPVELSMFDYSNIFLPVQALNNEVVRRALDIKSLYEDMDIDVETNQLWLFVYGEYTIEEDSKIKWFDTYGDFYNYYLGLLKAYRQRKFSDVVKPDWYVE